MSFSSYEGAPESGQDYGNVAKEFTAEHCKGKRVTIIQTDIDRYGRVVGLVLINADTLNTMLLKAGLAWHYRRYDANEEWTRYEKDAKDNKLGLWSMANAVAPWDWRKKKSH